MAKLPKCDVAVNNAVVSNDALACRSAIFLTLDKALRDNPKFYKRVPGVITGRYTVSEVTSSVQFVRSSPITTKTQGRQAERIRRHVERAYSRDGGEVGEFGDGTFLEWLMENLPAIIQAFMAMCAV